MKNHILRLQKQPTLLHQQPRKLTWLSLPSLKPLSRFYTRSNFIKPITTPTSSSSPSSSISAPLASAAFVIDKNCITFLTVTLADMSIDVFKQEFLDWEPLGGLCLSNILVLYNQHSINFYLRSQNLKKSCSIKVMQTISTIKSSYEQKVIGMTVHQKKNLLFLWHLHDITNKPTQQIDLSQKIIKWQFSNKEILTILTQREFQIYYPEQNGQYCLQYFIQIAHQVLDFCFLDRPKVNEHSGRKSVYTVAVLSGKGKVYVYEMFDIDCRVKNSVVNVVATVEVWDDAKFVICGFENQNEEIVVCGQRENGKPFTVTLNNKFIPKKSHEFLPQLSTKNPQKMQYCKETICTQDQLPESSSSKRPIKQFRLYSQEGKDKFKFITEIQTDPISTEEQESYAILGGYNFFIFQNEKMFVYRKLELYSEEKKIVINDVKVKDLLLLEQRGHIVYFVAGVKIYRLDLETKVFKVHGFVVKNDRFKLVQVRNQTRSILYTSSEDYVLMEYQTPANPEKQSQKITTKTIKSSPKPLISLRNNRWLQKHPQKLRIGESSTILTEFDLSKFFKLLTLETTLLPYEVYWTTHDGILLLIKNYLFVLELIESSEGYSLNIIKRSLNYLHGRFDPDADGVQIMDARNVVVREGKRILKLDGKIGSLVSEDPYGVPDTLLRRQLLMRKIYPPHHPKIIQYLIQMGYFDMLDKMFQQIWQWLKQNSGLLGLYKRIGSQFFISNKQKKQPIKKQQISLMSEQSQIPILKQLCQKILQSPHQLHLDQNYPLILESQIQSLLFQSQNTRSLDLYSSPILTQFKTFQTKNQSFKTMHIAYMLHSINKEQAIAILRQEKQQIDWDWIKKYSIVLWYENKAQIKNWVEEIGGNLFKVNKEPLDCLFWYLLAGKKNVLVQLFKKYIYNTAEHEKIFKFLQRDFSDAKNQNAAVNNAYALVDKKRYLHALAFFICGNKIDEAISVCLSKLKDINLAFLMCYLIDDGNPTSTNSSVHRNKLIDIMLKEGDIWLKHISYYYKNQHIDSFNCLFEQDDLQVTSHWGYEPKLSGFHPCLKQFAQNIQKSIPVKRQLQQQQLKKTQTADPNDIFQSFYGSSTQQQISSEPIELKQLTPNYPYIESQSISYFNRNSSPILSLMLDPKNHKALRSYNLSKFLLTKEVNETVMELIYDMEDYVSIVDAKIASLKIGDQGQGKQQSQLKEILDVFIKKFGKAVGKFLLSQIKKNQKYVIGQLMHYGYLGQQILTKLSQIKLPSIPTNTQNLLLLLTQLTKLLLLCQLQSYQLFQQYMQELITTIIQPQKHELPSSQSSPFSSSSSLPSPFWCSLKQHYDSLLEEKKNKKENLYDVFEQSLYKYTYKKKEFTTEQNYYKIDIYKSLPIFVRKCVLELTDIVCGEKFNQTGIKFNKFKKQLESVLNKWADDKVLEELGKQYNMMLNQGVVSKLKLNFLPSYLCDNFQPLCRGLLLLRSKSKKPYPEPTVSLSRSVSTSKPPKFECIQLFRNRIEQLKQLTINKNQGNGMQLAILTKRGIKKMEICDSLINKNRTQNGLSLLQDDVFQYSYGVGQGFDFNGLFQHSYLPIIEKYVHGVLDNRKQYEGVGIIKGSAKRWTPQYLKPLDPPPFFQFTDINCIECHHFLPIYMLGNKASIELCTFSANTNYHRIKCPTMLEIMKIRSYENRVTALDKQGSLSSYNLDSKIAGNCVFSLKKANVIDFCQMTPTIYGICTQNSIQVIDSLLHPKRQTVFKVQTNQIPSFVDYFSQTKLSICRKTDMQVYDTRMDILQQSRDMQGKVKCLASNHKNMAFVGKGDNKVRVIDLKGVGGEADFDVKVPGKYGEGEKFGVENIQVMGAFVVVLNGEGIVSMFNVGD